MRVTPDRSSGAQYGAAASAAHIACALGPAAAQQCLGMRVAECSVRHAVTVLVLPMSLARRAWLPLRQLPPGRALSGLVAP